jgi:putative transcriptional regulator
MNESNDFGARLKERLRVKNWNQSDLARACKLGRDSISTYINGTVKPTPKNLARIANALGCTPADLLPDYTTPVNEEAVMEMTQLPDGKMRLKIIQAVELDQALQIFSILKK